MPEVVDVGQPWSFTACPLPFPPPSEPGGPCPDTADGFPAEAALKQAAPGYSGDIHYAGGGRSWGQAFDAAAPGDIIALGPGVHGTDRLVDKDVALVGACPQRTTISGLRMSSAMLLADVTVAAGEHVALVADTDGGTVRILRVVVESALAEGVLAAGPATEMVVEDLAVRSVSLSPDGEFGYCLHGSDGARLTARRVDLQDCPVAGVASGNFAEVRVEDLAVRRSPGAVADGGGRLVIERATIEDAIDYGVVSLTSRDDLAPPSVEVTDVRVSSGPDTLVGIVAAERATLKARRVLVEGPFEASLSSEKRGDLEVRDAVARGPTRRVIGVEQEGLLEVTALHGASWASEAALTVIGAGTPAEPIRLTDIVLTDGEARGVDLQLAEVALERVAVRGARDLAVLASGSEVRLSDLLVQGMRSDERVAGGHALIVQEGASVFGRRIRVESARDAAVYAFGGEGRQTLMELHDLAIVDTLAAECASLTDDNHLSCGPGAGENQGGGNALMSLAGALTWVEDFEIRRAALSGVVVARDGQLDLRRGVVTGSELGLNVLVDGYDLDRLAEEVFVFDNGTDFARKDVPLPDPAELVSGAME